MTEEHVEIDLEHTQQELAANKRIQQIAWMVVASIAVFLLGLGAGYLQWGKDETAELKQQKEATELSEQISPKDGYTLPVSYGDLGPQLVEGGVIDFDVFAAIYEQSGNPLSPEEIAVLKDGSDKEIVINAKNAHFVLNFFWAVGLANRNSILTEGPMVALSNGQIEGFASTGCWGLASKPVTEIYASMDLISLTPEQQKLVQGVAEQVYRPCCNNHTAFPDCNHGMAMLGILELMASKGATANQMFEAAKYINAYWFPQQTLETAMYLKANQNIDFADADAKLVVGNQISSASGAKMIHADLQSKGLLQQAPGQGGSCAN